MPSVDVTTKMQYNTFDKLKYYKKRNKGENLVMSKLIVIGNGFDIAHGLPTKYSDFLKYIGSDHSKFYELVCQYIPEDALWSCFEEALSYLDDEQLKDDNSCYLLGYGDDNWRDSAHHDFQYMIGEALSFASDIPHYFSKWIATIDTDVRAIKMRNIIKKNSLFLCFNYTDTLEKIYGIPEERVCYIHGKAKRGDFLVLGHHDDSLFQDESIPQFQSQEECDLYWDNYDEDVRITEAKEIIKSYFKATYKDTKAIIQTNQTFFTSLNSVDEIFILGHSLSEIDFGYFDEINKNVPSSCNWHISYHSPKDLEKANKLISTLNLISYNLFEF